MSDLDAYFSEAMPEDERLTNYRAFAAGAAAGLDFFMARVKSYCDLLEVELEDHALAQTYLRENLASLARAKDVLSRLQALLQTRADDFEALDLGLLLQGVATRLKRIGRAEFNFAQGEPPADHFIQGRLFLIQQAMFELPHFFGSESLLQLQVGLERRQLDTEFFKSRRARLAAGEYFTIALSRPGTAADLNRQVCYTEKLVTGAGLTLSDPELFVYGIILEHGGELLANREGDTLAALTILLPTVHNQVEMFSERSAAAEDLKGTETILLVDDEGIIWDVVIDMLQGLGYTVILAENGRDCVEIYRENLGKIDLVLLDMVMPEMNGHEAFFALKEIDAKVRVLLQSGYIAQEEARDVLDAGALGFLHKPYKMAELAAKIRSILG